ncbi:zinc-binding dehydrogenase [Micromonospora sp. NPDC050200]|uniref:zinc-binding dehydrogenase n=1 Tax=Micromonospora sp. NPDC050200 TaxID=3155664 RepID=UPI0033D3B164
MADKPSQASWVEAAGLSLAGLTAYGPSTQDLTVPAGLVDAGRLTVHVGRTFPLAQAADAQRLVAEGQVRGKVVLEVCAARSGRLSGYGGGSAARSRPARR